MAIINSSANLHGVSYRDASFAINVRLTGTFEAQQPYSDAEWDGEIFLEGDLEPESYRLGDDTFQSKLILDGDWSCETALVLQNPPPITPTVAANAFSNQRYAGGGGRLYINNVLTSFISAEISAPGKTLGKSLKIELARADLAQLPPDAKFKFQIGKIVNGAPVWTTILDGGKLSGRSYSMTAARSSLSFSATAADAKLDKFPRNNLIVYDQAKSDISTDELEPLETSTGEPITTAARSVSVLTLYKLLRIAFVEGCGFADVETDIPDHEIARCDFSVTNSYAAAVAPFIGVYEPEMSVTTTGALSIQKTINPLPASFTPNQLIAARYPNFTETLSSSDANLDGYIVQYTARAGTVFADRNLPVLVEPSGGSFGDPSFTETTVRRKVRDWFETGNPVAVRTEAKEETRETRRNGVTVGYESSVNTFDRLGRPTGYARSLHARMPDVMQDGNPSLLKTREGTQKISYKSNPFAPRQTVVSKVETLDKALLAIDEENQALDEFGNDAPYAQDYEKVYEAGNLKKQMTSEFRTLEAVTEYFRPLQNGQVEVRTERFDALRGKPKTPQTDVRSGDISTPNFTKQKTKTIFRPGVTQATRTGELKTLNLGELPLFFGEPLVVWMLSNPRVTGAVEVVGYDESIERGVFFALKGREGEALGNFKTLGYTVKITPGSIMTQLDALKV